MTLLTRIGLATLLAITCLPRQAQADDHTDREILRALRAIQGELRALRAEVAQLKGDRTRPRTIQMRVERDGKPHAGKPHAGKPHAGKPTWHAKPTMLVERAYARRPAKGEQHEAVIVIEGPDGERKVIRRKLDGKHGHDLPAEVRKELERVHRMMGQEAHGKPGAKQGEKRAEKRGEKRRVFLLRDGAERKVEMEVERDVRRDIEQARQRAAEARQRAASALERARRARASRQPRDIDVDTRVEGGKVIVEIEVDGKTIRRVIDIDQAEPTKPARGHRALKFVPAGEWRELRRVPALRAVPAVPARPRAPKARPGDDQGKRLKDVERILEQLLERLERKQGEQRERRVRFF